VTARPPALAPAVDRLKLADALFISDLHLAESEPATLTRFLRFLGEEARAHAELVILGDLFEYWVGDDAYDDAVGRTVTEALGALATSGVRVFVMQGNRDLLLGEDPYPGAQSGFPAHVPRQVPRRAPCVHRPGARRQRVRQAGQEHGDHGRHAPGDR
jgi:hypothetical protein